MKPLDFKVSVFFFREFQQGSRKREEGFRFDLFRGACSSGWAIYDQHRESSTRSIGYGASSKRFVQAIIVNSGNAMPAQESRMKDAKEFLPGRRHLEIGEELVFPSSTGVIGNPLPMKKIEERIPELVKSFLQRLDEYRGSDDDHR